MNSLLVNLLNEANVYVREAHQSEKEQQILKKNKDQLDKDLTQEATSKSSQTTISTASFKNFTDIQLEKRSRSDTDVESSLLKKLKISSEKSEQFSLFNVSEDVEDEEEDDNKGEFQRS